MEDQLLGGEELQPELSLADEALDLLPTGTTVFWARFRPRLYWWFIMAMGVMATVFLLIVALGCAIRQVFIAGTVFLASALVCASMVGVILMYLYFIALRNYRTKEGGGRGIFLFPTGELIIRLNDTMDRTFEADEWEEITYRSHFSLLQVPFRCTTKRDVLHFTYTHRETGKVKSCDLDTFLMVDPPAVICAGIAKKRGAGGGRGRGGGGSSGSGGMGGDENPFGDGAFGDSGGGFGGEVQ